jgi:cytochrome c-type biogenesis protein CcmE
MKKTHILLLLLIAAGIAVFVSVFADVSTYETFTTASAHPGNKYHVMGHLQKDQEMIYDPKVDANHFIFFAKDKEGKIQKVIFNGEKPRDIEKSEQLVMLGGYDNQGNFKCSSIQMKCPSKYKKNEMTVSGKEG